MGRRQILVLGNAILEMQVAARCQLSLVGSQDTADARRRRERRAGGDDSERERADTHRQGDFRRVSERLIVVIE